MRPPSSRVGVPAATAPPALIEVWLVPEPEAADALRRLLGGPPERTPSGKPHRPGGPHVNLSHSGGWALVAACADTELGVDLEAPRVLRNPEGLARRMGTPAERGWLAAQPDRDAALLWLWTRKEAVAKADGGGIATALSGLEVLGPTCTVGSTRFGVHSLRLPLPGYAAAVAWR